MSDLDTGADYYFVSLGRVRGGLLDLLGLSQSATEVEVGKRQAEYASDVKRGLKRKRKELKVQVADGVLTQEEYDAQVSEGKEACDKKLAELNEATAKYDRELAEQRKLRRAGQVVPSNTGWISAPVALDDIQLLESALRHRALPGQSDDELVRMQEQAAAAISTEGTGLAALIRRRAQAVNTALLQADALWLDMKYTNRSHWAEVVLTHAERLDGAFPRFTAARGGGPKSPLFPLLSQPKNSTATLKADDGAQLGAGPQRKGRLPSEGIEPSDVRAALAQMLARQLAQQQKQGEPGASKVELPPELAELLENLEI